MVFFPTDNIASIVYQALGKNREVRAVALDISKNFDSWSSLQSQRL